MWGCHSIPLQKHDPRWRAPAILSLVLLSIAATGQPVPQHGTARPLQESRAVSSEIQQAEELIHKGNFQRAREILEEQVTSHSSSIEAYNLLGIVCTNEKDYAHAADAFDKALKLAPNSTKTRINLGNLFVAEEKLDLAEKEFQQVLRTNPADRDANYNLGLLFLAKGSPAESIPYFQRVRPRNTESQFNLIRAYLQAHRTADALNWAHELSAAHKSDVQLHFTLGVLLAEAKQYKTAQFELQQANALQPETFEILHNLGQTYLREHDYAKADLTLSRALKLKPQSADTLYLLAQVYSNQSRPVDALDVLVRAHKLAPENTDVIFLMARVSMTQNYFEDAIPLLESGLKIAPNRPDLHAALGESYFMSGKVDSAVAEFKRLIELDPSAASYAFMGLSYRHLGRFDEALKYFNDGLKLDPHNTSCLYNVGYIQERQGNYARAEELFQQVLRSNPDFPDALLELANLRVKDKKYAEAVDYLRRFVKVSHSPADGYYKLAMAERSLHQIAAAQRDLSIFQTLSKNSTNGTYPYQHLFDYLDNRSTLTSQQRAQLDVSELTDEIKKHPDQPQNLYLLSEAYLKLGELSSARQAIAQLDQISATDYRTQTGIGVLLARYHLYDDAIQHFQTALRANPDSDDVKFDLADAYLRKGRYPDALQVAQTVSAAGQQDDSFLSLLGDIEAHAGDPAQAADIFRDAIHRNPDNDQYYLSLALLQLRENDLSGADQTLQRGLARIPGSGKLIWGTGLVAVLHGNAAEAAQRLERAVELLPEWAGSYSTLGVFYYQIGEIDKAREVLDRFKGSSAGGLDVNRIEQVLETAPARSSTAGGPIPIAARQQVFQLALMIADRSL